MSGAQCPQCGCASRFPGRVVWCAQCGWLELVQEDADDGRPLADVIAVARGPRPEQLPLGVIVPSEWHRNPTGDLFAGGES